MKTRRPSAAAAAVANEDPLVSRCVEFPVELFDLATTARNARTLRYFISISRVSCVRFHWVSFPRVEITEASATFALFPASNAAFVALRSAFLTSSAPLHVSAAKCVYKGDLF